MMHIVREEASKRTQKCNFLDKGVNNSCDVNQKVNDFCHKQFAVKLKIPKSFCAHFSIRSKIKKVSYTTSLYSG